MITDAKWEPRGKCPQLPDGLVRLYTTDDGVDYLVHRSGRYAVRVEPVGGGWSYDIARLNRRTGDRRATSRGLGYWQREGYDGGPRPEDTRRVFVIGPESTGPHDRRNPDRALDEFLELHGNGEADR